MYRVNRSIQAEGAIGVVKEDYGFRRFSMRGTENVRIESLLMAFGYNVNKLHNKIQQDRRGHKVHIPKKAAEGQHKADRISFEAASTPACFLGILGIYGLS